MSERRIVLIHGIWMPGSSMRLLARKLGASGYTGHLFSYASVFATLDENAALLAEYIDARCLEGAHLVGHSLGGIVALRMLKNRPDIDVGRLVCLGSPLNGSVVAANLARRRWGRAIAGNTLAGGVVDQPASEWASGVVTRFEIGSIAGTVPVGAGRLLATFDGDNDGTVAVAETKLQGLGDHLRLPVNHIGLVLSRAVARQITAFLEEGAFRAPP